MRHQPTLKSSSTRTQSTLKSSSTRTTTCCLAPLKTRRIGRNLQGAPSIPTNNDMVLASPVSPVHLRYLNLTTTQIRLEAIENVFFNKRFRSEFFFIFPPTNLLSYTQARDSLTPKTKSRLCSSKTTCCLCRAPQKRAPPPRASSSSYACRGCHGHTLPSKPTHRPCQHTPQRRGRGNLLLRVSTYAIVLHVPT